MSILQIRSHIEKETESEVQDILQKAQAEARTIIEDAKKKAAALVEEHKQKQAMENLSRERSELAILRMNQKGELTKVKAEWLDRIFNEARKRLDVLAEEADSPAYRDFLTSLVVEGTTKMKGSTFTIQSNPQASELLRKNLKAITKRITEEKGEEVELQIESQPDFPPGVIIHSYDKHQYYNNTLDARLTGARQSLSGELYSLLFR